MAKQELGMSARTNAELRAMLEQFGVENDEASVAAAKRLYPELAVQGDATFRRRATSPWWLAIFRFSSGGWARRRELIEMLTDVVMTYWKTHGVEVLQERSSAEAQPVHEAQAALDEERRTRALSLIRQAAELLSSEADGAGGSSYVNRRVDGPGD